MIPIKIIYLLTYHSLSYNFYFLSYHASNLQLLKNPFKFLINRSFKRKIIQTPLKQVKKLMLIKQLSIFFSIPSEVIADSR